MTSTASMTTAARTSDDRRWERAQDVMGFPSGDDYVLHSLTDDEYYTLPGATAGFIWELCDGATTFDQMVVRIVESFEADEATVRTDLGEFLADLTEKGLIVPVQPTAA